jgi:hypothetical protein
MKYQLGDFTVKYWNSWDRVPRSPAQIGFAILGQLGIMASTTVAIFVGLATIAAVSWIAKSLMPKFDQDAFGSSSGLMTNTRNATAPQEIVYGTIRKGGIITYLESTGSTNEYLHQIICLAGHEVEAIGNIYINDQEIASNEIDNDGFVTNSTWQDNDGNSTILIKKFLGSPTQNVYTTLNALSDGPSWANGDPNDDTNFRGQGIACLYVRLKYNQDVFHQGVPLFTAVVQGKKVYDPRSSSTAFSANAALCIRDYLTSAYGINNSTAINDTVFSTAANTCDENVTLSGGGTEKRYEINGVLSLDRQPKDILGDMVAACAGTLFWGQGEWQLVVGEYTSPVKTLTLSDFRSDITISTKHSRRDNFNIVRGTFNDSNADYIRSDFPEIKSSTFISDDAGAENALDMQLPLTTSSAMAQRLAKLTLFRSREQMTVTADFSLAALEIQVGDIIGITNARYGWSAKDFEVIGWKLRNDNSGGELKVSLTLRETSSAAFSWSAEEEELKANDSTLTDIRAGLTPSNLTVTDIGNVQNDGSFVTQARVSWTAATSEMINHYEIEWKKTSDSNYFRTEIPSTDTAANIGPLESGAQYNVRVRAVSVRGNTGSFIATTHTVGGDTTAPSPVTSLSATGGQKQVTLDWTAPTTQVGGDDLFDLKGYNIYRATTNSQPTDPIAFALADKFTDTALAVNTQFYYWITAVDFTGNESTAVSANATTDATSSGVDTDTRIYSGILYYTTIQATAPSAPTDDSGTFDVSNEAFSTTPTGWSHSQTTVSNTSFSTKEWTVTYTVEVDVNDTVQSITYGTVNGAFQITDTIESDNFSAGSQGWRIHKDGTAEFGSGVIRDTLSVGQIPNLSQGKILNLSGDLSNIQADATQGINDAATAQSTANTANTNASNAQSTANTANTTATNAQNTANTANSTANTAVADAATAQSTANSAVSDAATAQSTANSAQSTANTANSTANTANSTANTALSTAQSAQTTALGKATVFYQNGFPSSGVSDGDLLFHTGNEKYYHRQSGAWTQASIEADSIVASYVYAGEIAANKITSGTLDVLRMPQLGQANSTNFNTGSISRNGSAASVVVSFNNVKSGASVLATMSIAGNASNVNSPYLRVTPTASSVTLDNSNYLDIDAHEGSFAAREYYAVMVTGSTTSTSGSVGFNVQLRGNDSGTGSAYGVLSVLVLSG